MLSLQAKVCQLEPKNVLGYDHLNLNTHPSGAGVICEMLHLTGQVGVVGLLHPASTTPPMKIP